MQAEKGGWRVWELSVPFLVLIVPLSFPTLGHLGRWRPRWRDEVGHSSYCEKR